MRYSSKTRPRMSYTARQRLRFLYIMQQFEQRAMPIDFDDSESVKRAQVRLENINRRIRAIRSLS